MSALVTDYPWALAITIGAALALIAYGVSDYWLAWVRGLRPPRRIPLSEAANIAYSRMEGSLQRGFADRSGEPAAYFRSALLGQEAFDVFGCRVGTDEVQVIPPAERRDLAVPADDDTAALTSGERRWEQLQIMREDVPTRIRALRGE